MRTSAFRGPWCSPLPKTLRSTSTLLALEATSQEPNFLKLNCTDYSCYYTLVKEEQKKALGHRLSISVRPNHLKGKTVFRMKWVSIFSCLPAFPLHPGVTPVSSKLEGKMNAWQCFLPHSTYPFLNASAHMFRPHLLSRDSLSLVSIILGIPL